MQNNIAIIFLALIAGCTTERTVEPSLATDVELLRSTSDDTLETCNPRPICPQNQIFSAPCDCVDINEPIVSVPDTNESESSSGDLCAIVLDCPTGQELGGDCICNDIGD